MLMKSTTEAAELLRRDRSSFNVRVKTSMKGGQIGQEKYDQSVSSVDEGNCFLPTLLAESCLINWKNCHCPMPLKPSESASNHEHNHNAAARSHSGN